MESSTPNARRRRETVIPTLAVGAVAVVALAAAVMVKRTDDPAPAVASARQSAVVTAPPLAAPDTKAMGGAAACASCGVVRLVVAVNEPGQHEPRAYQMHIRMDNGSTRTVQQRGALAVGSRVKVDGDRVVPVS